MSKLIFQGNFELLSFLEIIFPDLAIYSEEITGPFRKTQQMFNLNYATMKNNYILLGLITFFFLIGACSDDDPIEPDDNSNLENKEFISESLLPNFMDNSELRKMEVYTPPGYDNSTSKSYPVVYLLPGLPLGEKSYLLPKLYEPWIGEPMPFVAGPDFPAEGFREWVDGLIKGGQIEPMIIVMPDADNNLYGWSMFTNSILNGGFENYIVNDLVKYIDSNYRTIASKDGRALIGVSQGGYGAIRLGMLHPDKFSVVASHTGLVYLDGVLALGEVIAAENPDGIDGPDPAKFLTSAMYAFSAAFSPNMNNPPWMVDIPIDDFGAVIPEIREKWLEHDVFTMLDDPGYLSNTKSLKGIYLDAGTLDELGMDQMAMAFDAKLIAFGVTHTYETFEGGHFSKLFSRLEISLEFCSDKMN